MTDSLFEHAIQLHNAGQVDDALALYQQIVEADPTHAGAIHLLGVVLSQKGEYLLAVQFIQNAIVLNDQVPEFHINLGNALMGLQQWAMAEHAYAAAIAIKDNIPEAWFGLGNVRVALQKPQDAVASYDRALQLRPNFVEVMVNLGGLLITLQQLDRAVTVLSQAATLRPHDAQPRYQMAQALEAAGHPAEAATLYVSLAHLAHCPLSLLFEAGKRVARLGQPAGAADLYRAALLLSPHEGAVWNNLGNALRELDQLEESRQAFVQALDRLPNDAKVLTNLGTVLKDLGQVSDALPLLQRAVSLGGDAVSHSNLGHALYLQGKLAEATQCFTAALTTDPHHPDARFHLGVAQLRQGLWQEGWANYEARWARGFPHEQPRHNNISRWDGGDLTGQTILLWSEQGLGDTLHFIRYVSQVKAKGAARIVVECQPSLVTLLSLMPLVDQAVAVGQKLPPSDVQAPLLSLPHLLQAQIQPQAPYLTAPSNAPVGRLAGSLPKVGLVWAGESRRHDVESRLIDRRRSLALGDLAPVLAVDGIDFVSLQLGPPRDQLKDYAGILDATDRLNDFAHTAALVDQLDLVISVDTSVAHLAAAMGKPVWLLSRFDGCWRWQQGRSDTPWYASMVLYTQSRAADWQTPIAALAQDLQRWVESQQSAEAV